MAPLFVELIENLKMSYVYPHMGLGGWGLWRFPIYAGDLPPAYPEQFNRVVDETRLSYKPNTWELGDVVAIADAAKTYYLSWYKVWVNQPLAGDATDAVKKWQAEERAKEGQAK